MRKQENAHLLLQSFSDLHSPSPLPPPLYIFLALQCIFTFLLVLIGFLISKQVIVFLGILLTCSRFSCVIFRKC